MKNVIFLQLVLELINYKYNFLNYNSFLMLIRVKKWTWAVLNSISILSSLFGGEVGVILGPVLPYAWCTLR